MSKQTGNVKWFDNVKGFGFIEQDIEGSDEEAEDLFAHYSYIDTEDDYKTLNNDARVEFEVEETEKGKMATNITEIDN